jgi:adenosylhomocysteine nucleosidase
MNPIAVLVAMSMEAAPLAGRMEDVRPEVKAGKKFLRGRVGGVEVVLHRCGAGMRRATAGARALIENYAPRALLNYGVSGGMAADVALNDTVVALSCYPASGKYAGAGGAIPTDAGLAAFAAGLLPRARLAPVSSSAGLILRKGRKARIVAKSGAACMDMESYAAAKTARELGVPLLVLRCISDTVEPASLAAFLKNGRPAAEKAAAETAAVIEGLGGDPLL